MDQTLKVLVIAEAANPEWTSVPLVGWSHYKALSEILDVHLATQVRNRDALIAAGLRESIDFTSIDSEMFAAPLYKLGTFLRGGTDKAWTIDTAVASLSYYYFEKLIWDRFFRYKSNLKFNLVHRITPLSPTTPSILARRLHFINVPFVIGPLNGGVAWPKKFLLAKMKEREWLASLRSVCKLLPGYRGTREYSRAIVVGSKDTWRQYSGKYEDKMVYIPENGIDLHRFTKVKEKRNPTLKAAFVGRLVPYKGCDILISAITPFIKRGLITLDIFGDGPERTALENQVREMGIQNSVKFHGFVKNSQLQNFLVKADVFVFPSIREFGGGAILEAMALGVVPVVVEYGGPSELVNESCGYLVKLGSRAEIIKQIAVVLDTIIKDPGVLEEMGLNCRERVKNFFTWEAKARQTMQIYKWVIGTSADKPDFGMPF
jgi:glycosyltransferase involved in cell wall biosynthesis